jgi:hypothetical protein
MLVCSILNSRRIKCRPIPTDYIHLLALHRTDHSPEQPNAEFPSKPGGRGKVGPPGPGKGAASASEPQQSGPGSSIWSLRVRCLDTQPGRCSAFHSDKAMAMTGRMVPALGDRDKHRAVTWPIKTPHCSLQHPLPRTENAESGCRALDSENAIHCLLSSVLAGVCLPAA